MSNNPATRAQFLQALTSIQAGRADLAILTADLRQALLAFASETPDNVACASQIEVGTVAHELGIKFRNHNTLFCDIAHAAEELPLPEAMKSQFPKLTNADWQAFTRMTTLLYVFFGDTSQNPS